MNSKTTPAHLKQSRAEREGSGRQSVLPVLFAGTLFLSSALLFLVQPMFAKMVLPLLGGTPAVWNTCMVFFQAALLAGYAYAHVAPAKFGLRGQALLHGVLLVLPFLVLPITVARASAPPGDANPIPWLLGLLALTVGLPFFVVSTSGPLLQRWFAETGYPSSKDPYFLYSASNLGSMLALLSYPILLEPLSSLKTQSLIWMVLYGVFIILIFGCAFVLFRSASPPAVYLDGDRQPQTTSDQLRIRQRVKWIALAFVPSSLMLSVTTYFTTDLAAIPLLWVIPLAIYLLTFILVFARRPRIPQTIILRVLPFAVLALSFAMLSQATKPLWFLLLLHLVTFFLIGMMCHGELARQRPPVERLTEFYLWLSVGGVLGGLFNALLAPLIFNSVMEYPLVLMLACCMMPALAPAETAGSEVTTRQAINKKRTRDRRSLAPKPAAEPALRPQPWPAVLAFEAGLVLLPGGLAAGLSVLLRHLDVEHYKLSMALIFGLPVLLCFTYIHSRVRFGLAIGILLLAGSAYQGVYGRVLYATRSFFGIHRITLDRTGDFINLVHGNTVHGSQRVVPSERAEPLTYYHRSGPIGQVFTTFSGKSAKSKVAIVGLGAGSLAYYGEVGQRFTYYEIDPTVLHIARDSGTFTFLRDCKANLDVVLGDARLTLKAAPQNECGLIVMDAFSSDAIPVHLLTREALALYQEKLTPDGILAFHISNGYLDLAPELAALARDAHLLCWSQEHFPPEENANGVLASQWVLMAHGREDLNTLLSSGLWQELRPPPQMPVWTDDFSNIFSVLRWR